MKILGIIPARGGSKGIPRKNLYNINEKPLIQYTIEAALNSDLDDVIVSTDDKEIAEFAEGLNCKVIMRPAELALDNTPSLPVLQHVVQSVETKYDAVMTLQPTSPLRSSIHINEAIEMFRSDSEANSLVSVVMVPHNMVPESVMFLNDGYLEPYLNKQILRRQDKPVYYARNGAAIYITKTKDLDSYIWGGKILMYEMTRESSIDIDDMDDIKLAIQLTKK